MTGSPCTCVPPILPDVDPGVECERCRAIRAMGAADRYATFIDRARSLAADLRIEVEFTTAASGDGYMRYEAPCVEVVTTDTHEYLQVEGRVVIEGKK